MRYLGIHYDTGVRLNPAWLSRTSFDHELVRYELRAIKEELHANAVRVVGEELDRLRFAAETAVELGMTVFLNPWLINRGEDELLAFLDEAAAFSEDLRAAGGDIVFVVAAELAFFGAGIIPGSNVVERIGWLQTAGGEPSPEPSFEVINERLNAVLGRAAGVIRGRFAGPVTYAAAAGAEDVDWSVFDIVGLDYYRTTQTDEQYAQGLRAATSYGLPVAVLEIGCCAYEGGYERGPMGWTALHDGNPPRWESGMPPVRSEAEQARYLRDQLEVFEAEDVYGAFVFTFSAPYHAHDPDDPERDYDMVSYGITKHFSADTPRGREMPPWEPKEAFHAVAEFYERHAARSATTT